MILNVAAVVLWSACAVLTYGLILYDMPMSCPSRYWGTLYSAEDLFANWSKLKALAFKFALFGPISLAAVVIAASHIGFRFSRWQRRIP